jgi:hypothetical protein
MPHSPLPPRPEQFCATVWRGTGDAGLAAAAPLAKQVVAALVELVALVDEAVDHPVAAKL